MWDTGYRYGLYLMDVVIHHIDVVTLDIDMGYGLMIWEMTVSIWSSLISIWETLSLWYPATPAPSTRAPAPTARRTGPRAPGCPTLSVAAQVELESKTV